MQEEEEEFTRRITGWDGKGRRVMEEE